MTTWTTIKWCMYTMGCMLMCIYFFTSLSEPAEPTVKQIFSLVQIFGFFAVLIVPIVKISMDVAMFRSWSMAVLPVTLFLRGIAFYLIALWVIGNSGDSVYKWVLENPSDAISVAVALVIVWIVVSFSRIGSSSFSKSSSTASMASSAQIWKPTARDNRYTAAHEAGHVLVYAALGRLPNGTCLSYLPGK